MLRVYGQIYTIVHSYASPLHFVSTANASSRILPNVSEPLSTWGFSAARNAGMKTISYKRHRFPPRVIQHGTVKSSFYTLNLRAPSRHEKTRVTNHLVRAISGLGLKPFRPATIGIASFRERMCQ